MQSQRSPLENIKFLLHYSSLFMHSPEGLHLSRISAVDLIDDAYGVREERSSQPS